MSKEARLFSAALIALAVLSMGASYRTQNFVVTAATPQLAREICEKAESDRRELAIEWLGSELPPWRQPCPISVQSAPNMGAGGATSFSFNRGRPFGWTMSIQGSRERLLDSVVPHEVTHTIFATHFGRPLPRWADEGACTTVEHSSEKKRQERNLIEFLTTNRGIAFNRMFAMKEYPRDVLPLYAQGFSLARYLIQQGGKRKFVKFVGDGMDSRNWPASTQKHYGFQDLSQLQMTWLEWVRRGSPLQGTSPSGELLVSNNPSTKSQTQLASATSPLPKQTPINSIAPTSKMAARTVPVQPRETEQMAATPAGQSWYVRQRNSVGAKSTAVASAPRAVTTPSSPSATPSPSVPSGLQWRAGGYQPGSIGRSSSAMTSLSRPQPVGRPQQRVLERSSQNQPTTAPSGSGYLQDASMQGSTFRR